MVNETSLIHTFPRIVHLGSYLRQSDAEHPPNVVFLMIVEEEVSGLPLRSRANTPEFFFKARYELPPGTVLYADIAAFFAFVAWTPEAQQNFEDPGWDSPFPASEPGVYILEARIVSSGAPPGPLLLSPEAPGLSTDTSVPGTGVGDAALSAYGAPESRAAGEVISLMDSPERVLDSRSQFLIDDSSSTYLPLVVLMSFGPRHSQLRKLSLLLATSVRRRKRRSFWPRAKGVPLLVVLGTMATWRYPSLVVRIETGRP